MQQFTQFFRNDLQKFSLFVFRKTIYETQEE